MSSTPPGQIPQHVAIIMDGNGRWAKAHGLPRLEGHRRGVETVRTVVDAARAIGIRYLTLYAFSVENWKRPPEEVAGLMGLLDYFLKRELDNLIKKGLGSFSVGNIEAHDNGSKLSGIISEYFSVEIVNGVWHGGEE